MQVVAAIRHVHNVLSMQSVIGRLVTNAAGGVIVVHAGLLGAQTVLIVLEGDLIIALLAVLALVHTAHLTAADPGVVPGAVVGGIADLVIGNGLAIERSQLVLPVGVAVDSYDNFIYFDIDAVKNK